MFRLVSCGLLPLGRSMVANSSIHLPLFSALLLVSPYETTTNSSNIPGLGLPILRFTFVLSFNYFLNNSIYPQDMPYPIIFLFVIKINNDRSSPILLRTSSFVTLSIQLIFPSSYTTTSPSLSVSLFYIFLRFMFRNNATA